MEREGSHGGSRGLPGLLPALLLIAGVVALPACRTIEGFAADLRSIGGNSERETAEADADRVSEAAPDAGSESGPAVGADDGSAAAVEAEPVPSRRPAPRPRIGSSISRDEPLRGIWVTRWDYRTPEDVRTIMRNIDQAGFTDVFWQVRGQADAYYDSDLEPWGELLFRASNADTTRPSETEVRRGPGWDPLETAARAARGRGVRLHAWMNVMPLWKGTSEPVSRDHPYRARTAWRLKDDLGADQPLTDHYVIVNPVLDAVHDHLAAVTRDLATRYDLDGVHLDYIRFISESLDEGRWYPGDAVSRALYREAMGLGADAEIEPNAMRAWVRQRITDLVARISDEARRARPGIMLSAAVWRRPELAREQQLQDAARWVRMGTLDAVMPMMYHDSDAAYRSDLRAWSAAVSRRGGLVPGVGAYKHESGRQTAGQVAMQSGDDRFVLFAYSSLWRSAAPGSADTPEAESERLRRRVPLRAILRD